jgi:predicted nucleic acid-binding protein
MLKRSRINLEQAIEAIDVYQSIALEIVDINLKDAVRLAGKHNIYAYDAYILQCALENSLPLISLDKNLIAIARQEGITIIEVAL